mgnify:CR=1 FL=1
MILGVQGEIRQVLLNATDPLEIEELRRLER